MWIGKRSSVLMALLVFGAASMSYGADMKIGVIDLQKVFEESSAGKQIRAEITKKGSQMEEDLKEKSNEIDELKKKLEKETAALSKEQREKKEREIDIKIYDIKSLKKKYNEELMKLQQAKLESLKKDIFEIVKQLGEKEGFTLIIEKVGVLYLASPIDVTDKFIEMYNAKAAK